MAFTNYIQQIKGTNNTTYDLVDSSASHFVKGTQTAATNVWTGALPDGVTAYYDGLTIDYFLPYAGTSTAATLNLGSKGAKPVYVGNGTDGVTTHFPQYSVLHLTYIVNSSLNSGNGCWKVTGYYNTNTTYSAGTGLSLSSTTFNHSNSITAQTTQGLYPIKIDAQGHITAYGSAQTIPTTASEVGAAASSHTHGNITSGGDITATAPTIASGDQIIINDNSASKITNGPTFDGSTTTKALSQKGTWETFSNSLLYGECSTAVATVAKTVTVDSSFKLVTGASVAVKFSVSNTAASPTLNVNNTGAKEIKRYGTTAPSTSASTSWQAGSVVCFVYDGTYWQMCNWLNDNTMVTQNHSTSTSVYNMALANYSSSSGGTSTLNHSNKIQANPSTGDTLQSGRATTADLSSSAVTNFINELNVSGASINTTQADWVVEQGVNGIWTWRKWQSGLCDLWGRYTVNEAPYNTTVAFGYWYRHEATINLPFQLKNIVGTYNVLFDSAWALPGTAIPYTHTDNGSFSSSIHLYSLVSSAATDNVTYSIILHGRWE
jgi:hypothetical protein